MNANCKKHNCIAAEECPELAQRDEMLKALEAIVNSSDYGSPREGDDNRPLMRDARAIIAKASGHRHYTFQAHVDELYGVETVMCGECDGVGWTEGGETIKTTCSACGGRGEVAKSRVI